jgi:branched-subunit amino acid ABC-type transport system permease component
MRILNLMHGSFLMLGAHLGVTFLRDGANFWIAALASACVYRKLDSAILVVKATKNWV